MVAIFVKTSTPTGPISSFNGNFENIESSLNYLQYLEETKREFYVQIGFVGWESRTVRTV